MGQEPVYFKQRTFYHNNQIISWVQKFMELYLSNFNHPPWFKEILKDLHGDFFIPYRKQFFDEDIIDNSLEKLNYCVQMIDLVIIKMEGMSKKDFFQYIKSAIKDSWCDVSNSDFYNEQWFNDDENYKLLYIGSLRKLKELMLEDMGTL